MEDNSEAAPPHRLQVQAARGQWHPSKDKRPLQQSNERTAQWYHRYLHDEVLLLFQVISSTNINRSQF